MDVVVPSDSVIDDLPLPSVLIDTVQVLPFVLSVFVFVK